METGRGDAAAVTWRLANASGTLVKAVNPFDAREGPAALLAEL